MLKRILVVTPKLPYPPTGACEQDRYAGIEILKSLGWEVFLIAKIYNESYRERAEEMAAKLGIKVAPVVYRYLKEKSFWEKIKNFLSRAARPWYFDGAAWEYGGDTEIKRVFKKALDEFKPAAVWFDYTYLWPLYEEARKRKIKIITRSINFEPVHFLEENGRSLINFFVAGFKLLSEILAVRKSDLFFSITLKEEKIYKNLGAKNIFNLPLRGLPNCIATEPRPIVAKETLDVFFMGSTYNVAHNRRALDFIVQEVVPAINKKEGQKCFNFHIFGGKVPEELKTSAPSNVVFHGFVPDLNEELKKMDIALIPSLFGAGMQQKVFEPLVRGIPAITSNRGLGGYPFKDGEHLLLAENADDFIDKLIKMGNNIELRRRLSNNSAILSVKLFSRNVIVEAIAAPLRKLFI